MPLKSVSLTKEATFMEVYLVIQSTHNAGLLSSGHSIEMYPSTWIVWLEPSVERKNNNPHPTGSLSNSAITQTWHNP